MDEIDKTLNYIFILSLVLIAVAYYAGSTKVLGTIGQQVGNLILVSTGRTSDGKFADYPKGA